MLEKMFTLDFSEVIKNEIKHQKPVTLMSLRPFDMAAAGHTGIMTNTDESLFFKPALQKEITFYNKVKEANDKGDDLLSSSVQENDDVQPIDTWMPKYIGTMLKTTNVSMDDISKIENKAISGTNLDSLKIGNTKTDDQYIVLENLLNGYNNPNVMDIKLGKVLYDESASLEKKERLTKVARETTSGSMGMRICGMKMANHHKENYSIFKDTEASVLNEGTCLSVNKTFGLRLKTKEDIKNALKVFFNNHEAGNDYFISLLANFFERIEALIETLQNTRANFISSSILLIFESNIYRIKEHGIEDVIFDSDFDVLSYIEELDDENGTIEMDGEQIGLQDLTNSLSLSKLKLVDFGHSKVGKTLVIKDDNNAITGLYSLKDIFMDLLNEI